MGPRVGADIQPVRKLALAILSLAALDVGAQAGAQADDRAAAIDESSGVTRPDEAVDVNTGSDVSVRKTRKRLFVQVLHGEALLDARESGSRRVVVRAGNAQVRNFNAVVCVGMDSDRASVDVIDGAARVANVDARDHVVNEVTLHAGDRVEIGVRGELVSFRIASSGVGEQRPCRWDARVAEISSNRRPTTYR